MFSAEYDVAFDITLGGDFGSFNWTELTPLVEEWLKGAFPNSSLAVVGYRNGSIIVDVNGTAVIDTGSEPATLESVTVVVDTILAAYSNISFSIDEYPIRSVGPATVTGDNLQTTSGTPSSSTSPPQAPRPSSKSGGVSDGLIIGLSVGGGVLLLVGIAIIKQTSEGSLFKDALKPRPRSK